MILVLDADLRDNYQDLSLQMVSVLLTHPEVARDLLPLFPNLVDVFHDRNDESTMTDTLQCLTVLVNCSATFTSSSIDRMDG